MLFTNKNQIILDQNNKILQKKEIPNFFNRNIIRRPNNPPQSVPKSAETVVEEGSTKKMKWGEPTWFLFHTLAEKVKPEYFPMIRSELLNMISAICNNLPCPICAKHATDYLNGINFNAIQTKEQLKLLLFTFHNVVNKRKGVELFDYQLLDEKYSKANTFAIVRNFMYHFEDKTYNIKLLTNQFQRGRVNIFIKKWFYDNLTYFNP